MVKDIETIKALFTVLMLETLSSNRDLEEKLKEAENMLRDLQYEDLPSYEIGFERGVEASKDKWISQTTIQNAILMVREFNLDIKDVAKKLNIPLDTLIKRLK